MKLTETLEGLLISCTDDTCDVIENCPASVNCDDCAFCPGNRRKLKEAIQTLKLLEL